MARRQENEPIYKAFRDFIDLCILQDKSFLWPQENYWTLNNLKSVKKRLIEGALEGSENSFEALILFWIQVGRDCLFAIPFCIIQ